MPDLEKYSLLTLTASVLSLAMEVAKRLQRKKTIGSLLTPLANGAILFLIAILAYFCVESKANAEAPIPVSVVDFMKSVGLDSGFGNRKSMFSKKWPAEEFKGTAEQNRKLLKLLLGERGQFMLPFPSSNIDGCKEFYSNPDVARFLTKTFVANATSACIVTGTNAPQNTIRKKLQDAYKTNKPANGEHFTPEEHKKIHDDAYKAAGCREDSAKLWGWYVVDSVTLPAPIIKIAIERFGQCTIAGD